MQCDTCCDGTSFHCKAGFVTCKHKVHVLPQGDAADSYHKPLKLPDLQIAAIYAQTELAEVHKMFTLHQNKLVNVVCIAALLLP